MALGTKAEVGVFGAALRTATLTSLLLVAVNSMTAPKFAALWAKGDLQGLEKTAVKSAVLVSLSAAPILSILAFFPEQVLGLFGKDFASGAVALTILAAGQFVNAATGSVGYLLMMTGHGKWLWVSVVAGSGNVRRPRNHDAVLEQCHRRGDCSGRTACHAEPSSIRLCPYPKSVSRRVTTGYCFIRRA
ncbi:lipopolysaccharide biosynthesis protein [Deferrisoma camini]|uniref:lipopolysaccharide biosynthesis protein n=1 Tax=Deferrisoma camini TaxID=1035120 RepID=UPI00146B06E5|nr:hypothetical protein [Deferrisoma camini]